jgi:putative DNA methylase
LQKMVRRVWTSALFQGILLTKLADLEGEGTSVPAKTRIEAEIPVERLYELAIREGNSKKPVYEMHKWWARRLGSVFRMLLLLATAPANQSDEELWQRFYQGEDLSHLRLLDPFMGGGTSIVEATKLQIQTVGVDIDPVAWFVTRQEISPCELDQLEAILAEMQKSELAANIRALYQTTLPGQDSRESEAEADVVYNFWVDVLTCPHCQTAFEAHPHYILVSPHAKAERVVFCKTCYHSTTLPVTEKILRCPACTTVTEIDAGPVSWGAYTCPTCGDEGRIVDLARPGVPFPKQWFAIEYVDPTTKQRRFKAPDPTDHARYDRARYLLREQADRLPLPTRAIPLEGRADPRPTTHGYQDYRQLFNARQLLALGWVLSWITEITDATIRDYCLLAFSDALASNNLLCPFAYGYDKLTPLFGLHAYNMITRPIENNVWGALFGRGSFTGCLKKVIAGKAYGAAPYESRYKQPSGALQKVALETPIVAEVVASGEAWYQPKEQARHPRSLLLNQSSEALPALQDGTIDLILSDPPYYNTLSYSELSDFYYAWIHPLLAQVGATWTAYTTPYQETLYVRPGKETQQSKDRFTDGLTRVLCECARVLKDEGLLVFTFHHLDAAAWIPLTLSLLDAGFVVTNVFPVRSEGRSKFHSTEGTVKWDAVFVCRKRGTIQAKKAVRSRKGPEQEFVGRLARWATQATNAWKERFQAAEIPFDWPDALSLTYAFILQRATELFPALGLSPDQIKRLFALLSLHLANELPITAQQRLRKRKSKLSINSR